MNVTHHDIEVDGVKYILDWTHSIEGKGTIAITEACDPTPCDWFINDATVPSWCCSTHMYDGTGDYPADDVSGDDDDDNHPEVCPFSNVDEDGECIADGHEAYDFVEIVA